ncbi:hypothetical protein Tco_0872285 [Tanacetum coccineum]
MPKSFPTEGNVRPANDFYAKLNALMFVPQKELSGDQAYWLSANEIASQASKPATPPFVLIKALIFLRQGIIQRKNNDKGQLPERVCAFSSRESSSGVAILSGNSSELRVELEPLKGMCDQQALETDRIQLKEYAYLPFRIQLDSLKGRKRGVRKEVDNCPRRRILTPYCVQLKSLVPITVLICL